MPSAREQHDCREVLRRQWEAIAAEEGGSPIEITISTQPPLVRNPYTEGYICPHGVSYYIEPTGEQIAEWNAGRCT